MLVAESVPGVLRNLNGHRLDLNHHIGHIRVSRAAGDEVDR